MSDSGGLGRVLSQQNFDHEKFVNKQADKGIESLQQMHQDIQKLSFETSLALKKNVYKNYSQFIETAKEISILEAEMYQLSHMLTDQKSIIHSMLEISITGKVDNSEVPVDESSMDDQSKSNNLALLLERVEGCSSLLDKPGRYLVHDGDLVELHTETFSRIQKIHAFLLNDCLLLTSCLPQRRGPIKFSLQTVYELDSLAVVNSKDVENCRNAFKILKFPETKLFQVVNSKEKRQWLDILDATKRKKAVVDSQKREAAQQAALERQTLSDPTNPFAEVEEVVADVRKTDSESLLEQDWVVELPEDLDVYIAQRDFEAAVDGVERVLKELSGLTNTPTIKDYRARIEHRVKQLTEVLLHELQLSPERSICGGPNLARRAVRQLIRLGKSAQACSLFLKNRSAMIKYHVAQLKIEGNSITYVKRLCQVFFGCVDESAQEFIKAFPQHYGCFSSFVVWAKEEMEHFVALFSGQVFTSKSVLDTVADCVLEAKKCCLKLTSIGMDMTFTLERLLHKDLVKIITDAQEHQIEAVRHREKEAKWSVVDLVTDEEAEKFVERFQDLGLEDVHQYIYDSHMCYLAMNIQTFGKTYCMFAASVLSVYSPHLHEVVVNALLAVLTEQLSYCEKAWTSDQLRHEKDYVYKNIHFLNKCLWPAVQQQFLHRTTTPINFNKELCERMDRIHRQFAQI